MPVTKALVHEIAELLLLQRVPAASRPAPHIGVNWVSNFIKRHAEIEMKYNRKYDYKRAKCEDPDTIRAWFRLVDNTVKKYSIQQEDTYNFDESVFQVGVITTVKVLTVADRCRTVSIQPRNREWVTVIKAMGVVGGCCLRWLF